MCGNFAPRGGKMPSPKEFCSTIMDMVCQSQLLMVKFGFSIRFHFQSESFFMPLTWSVSVFRFLYLLIILSGTELYTIYSTAHQWPWFLVKDTVNLCFWLLCWWNGCQCLHGGIDCCLLLVNNGHSFAMSNLVSLSMPSLTSSVVVYLIASRLERF